MDSFDFVIAVIRIRIIATERIIRKLVTIRKVSKLEIDVEIRERKEKKREENLVH